MYSVKEKEFLLAKLNVSLEELSGNVSAHKERVMNHKVKLEGAQIDLEVALFEEAACLKLIQSLK